MGIILKSKTKTDWLLKVGDPAGLAYLEINGLSHHLNIPYLTIRYVPGGVSDKLVAGYQVEGWFVSGNTKPVTTPQFLAILRSLGFSALSANKFRALITQDLD